MRIALLPSLAVVLALACARDATSTAPTDSAAADPDRFLAHRDHPRASVVIPAPNGFTSTPLARGTFSDDIKATFRIKEHDRSTIVRVDDPSEMVTGRISMIPGGALPWHSHPGPVLVTVAAGELTLVDSHGCEVRRYPTGSSFMDSGQGHVHVAFNGGTTDVLIYATYLDVPAGTSPLVPAENPGC
jgi:quercetin dioxygenase-like cupin family protein